MNYCKVMKINSLKGLSIMLLMAMGVSTIASAQASRSSRTSRSTKSSKTSKSDTDVITLKDYGQAKITLIVVEDTTVYNSKKANTRLGTFTKGTQLELIALSKHAYQVVGKATHGNVRGWVNPDHMGSTDPDFIKNLKAFYERQISINVLIANKEIAIGMTLDEVKASIGEPTKTQSRVDKGGKKGKWEFITYIEQKHYKTFYDVRGQLFRQYSHSTTEESGKIVVEYEKDIVTVIEQEESVGRRGPRLISPPVFFTANL